MSIFLKSLLWKKPFKDMSCAISYQVIMLMFFCDFHIHGLQTKIEQLKKYEGGW